MSSYRPALSPQSQQRCRQLLVLMQAKRFRLAAEILEHAFDWDLVPPGRAFWEAAQAKLLRLAAEEEAAFIQASDSQDWDLKPITSYLETLRYCREDSLP